MNSEEPVSGLAFFREGAGLDVAGGQSVRLVDRKVNAPKVGTIFPDRHHQSSPLSTTFGTREK